MDLQIKINGEFVDLFPDTKIKYIFNSPAFNETLIMGDISQIVNLPCTGKNKRIFSFLNAPESYSSVDQIYECYVYSNGVKVIDGRFKLKKAGPDGFRGNIVGGASELKAMVSESKIKDIDFGGDITLGATDSAARNYLKSAAKSSYPTYPMVSFPVKNNEFMGDSGEVTNFQNTAVSSYAWGFVNNFLSDKFADLSGNVAVFGQQNDLVYFCPYLYIKFIIDKLFDEYDFTLAGDWYEDSEISTLVMHHLYCANDSFFPYTAPLSIDPTKLLPDMSVQSFLNGLKKMFNLGYFYNYSQRVFYIEPLKKLLSNTVVDWTEKAEPVIEVLASERKSGYKMDYTWDSEDDIPENYIKSTDGYRILTAVNSTAHLPSSGNSDGDVRYVRYECAYYIWAKNDLGVEEWIQFSYPYQAYTEGAGENEIKTETSTIPSAVVDYTGWDQDTEDYVGVEYKVPILSQPGNTPLANNLMDNGFSARILFYRGIKTDSRGYYYPLGQADNVDLHGDSSGDYSLKWDGNEGLYNTWWDAWNRFLDNAKETKWKLHLSLADILNIDMRKRIRIASSVYLIKKITIQFPFNGEADAELVKITAATTDLSSSGSSSSSTMAGDFDNASPNDDFNNDFWNT